MREALASCCLSQTGQAYRVGQTQRSKMLPLGKGTIATDADIIGDDTRQGISTG
jgi:hypothetical protein